MSNQRKLKGTEINWPVVSPKCREYWLKWSHLQDWQCFQGLQHVYWLRFEADRDHAAQIRNCRIKTLFFFCQITTAPIYPHCFHGKKQARRESLFMIYWMIGSTMPQANRFPAFPVFRLSGLPPRPKSSSVAWTTKARPLMSFTWPFCKGQTISELKFWCQIKENWKALKLTDL